LLKSDHHRCKVDGRCIRLIDDAGDEDTPTGLTGLTGLIDRIGRFGRFGRIGGGSHFDCFCFG